MIITLLNQKCGCPTRHMETRTLDTVIATALLAVAILALTGVLPIPGNISWAMLGGGAIYASIMLLSCVGLTC